MIGFAGLLKIGGLIVSLLLRSRRGGRLDGLLVVIHGPTSGALDGQADELGLGQLLVAVAAAYDFHVMPIACSLRPAVCTARCLG